MPWFERQSVVCCRGPLSKLAREVPASRAPAALRASGSVGGIDASPPCPKISISVPLCHGFIGDQASLRFRRRHLCLRRRQRRLRRQARVVSLHSAARVSALQFLAIDVGRPAPLHGPSDLVGRQHLSNGARGRIMRCKRHFNAHNSARRAAGSPAQAPRDGYQTHELEGASKTRHEEGRRGSVHTATRGKEMPSPRHREKRSRREWHEGDGGRRGTAAAHGEQGARRGGPESRSMEDEEIEARIELAKRVVEKWRRRGIVAR